MQRNEEGGEVSKVQVTNIEGGGGEVKNVATGEEVTDFLGRPSDWRGRSSCV